MDEPLEESVAARNAASPRAFEVALSHIEGLILDGTLSVGDRLPAERDLAAQLNVSRPAIREAMRTLEAQGVIASRVGSGATAGTHVINERSEALGRLLRLQVALAQFPLNEVTEARIALERSSIAQATARATADDIDDLWQQIEAMEEQTELDKFNELDTQFHITLAELAVNTFVGDLTRAVRESLRRPILEAEQKLEDWPAMHSRLMVEHRGIVQAMAAGDGSLAGDRVEAHIRNAYAILPLGSRPALS